MNFFKSSSLRTWLIVSSAPCLLWEANAATVVTSVTPMVLNNGDGGEVNLNASLGPVNDTTIELVLFVTDLGATSVLNLSNGPAARVATIGGGSSNAQRFGVGDSVGPTLTFASTTTSFNAALENANFGLSSGEWGGGETGFVGIRFDISGSTHYGFVRVSWFPDDNSASTASFAVIDLVGYNTVAGQPAVVAPEPSSTFLVLLSALPIAFFRRR